jgi:uncharacterized repeat protein (TIGR01451 family)
MNHAALAAASRCGRLSAILLACVAAPAWAGGTPAGTKVSNTATATYETATGAAASVTSNTVELEVDELLNVTVASGDPGDVGSLPSSTGQVLRFVVTNSGNGSEAFALTANDQIGGDDFNPAVTSLVLDTNGNGAYDAGVDTAYVSGTNDPVLDADGSVTVFVLSTIPGSAGDAQRGGVSLTATARTGSGNPGTVFAGAGTGGTDAVVGATRATSADQGYFKVSTATVTLAKSAAVADPFGGRAQVPGSVITYTLVATVNGSGSLSNVSITDPVPTGSTYEPNSLKLNGTALTDAADGDGGRFASNAITVALGTIAAGSSNTVTFRVKIN